MATIAAAAFAGVVDLLVYDADASFTGSLDDEGRITADPEGYDVLARIAIEALRHGGEVQAVTAGDLYSGVLASPALAHLRHAVSEKPTDLWPGLPGVPSPAPPG